MSLTAEIEHTILSFVRAGAFDHAAAEAAGVSARTFRDWMARGEGTHPTRPGTAKLRRFAGEVRRARAEARVAAEVRVYRDHPRYWLSHAARTTPERDGWTAPPVLPEAETDRAPTLEARIAELDRRQEERARQQAQAATDGCSNAQCTCPYHHRRYFDVFDRHRVQQGD